MVICGKPLSAIVPDCEALAELAALKEGVPAGLLSAIARVESGRTSEGKFRAWPWTLNQAGDGSYHATETDALRALDAALATGRRNVDVGCMQINVRWHSDAFADVQAMIDPVQNTDYAARYLRNLYDRHGDWTAAVMHYHSSDLARGQDYAARVMRQLGTSMQDDRVQAKPASPSGVIQTHGMLVMADGALVPLNRENASGNATSQRDNWALFRNRIAD